MFEIIDVTGDAGLLEPMGSKPKFWFDHPQWGSTLFKVARPGSGEDWSEKVAAEIAATLGIPHAEYQLAVWKGEHGIVTPRLTTEDERLVHGNELLIDLDPNYEAKSAEYGTPLHTVEAVFGALRSREVTCPKNWVPAEELRSGSDVFIGYLLLDALIGNTDRHHENWAAVEDSQGPRDLPNLALAPTFDHASCLGRNEPVDRMRERLGTKDEGFTVEAYARRARSALYAKPEDDQPLSPLEAFLCAAVAVPEAAAVWCRRLRRLDDSVVREIVGRVPEVRMGEVAKDFVVRMISFNRSRLEENCEAL